MSQRRIVDIRIRKAKLRDARQLAALICELGYETTSSEMRRRLKMILNDARYGTFVAEIEREICGMIGTLTHMSHEHNDLSGKIIALVVSENQRRSGIGRALITSAEKEFVKRNITRVTLTTRFAREEAHQFYEALGFSRTGYRFAKTLRASSESIADPNKEQSFRRSSKARPARLAGIQPLHDIFDTHFTQRASDERADD
jgi:ribosomal protein S18 acetylase RimI-like enzyme